MRATPVVYDLDGTPHRVYPISVADVGRLQARYGKLDRLDGAVGPDLGLAICAAALRMSEALIVESFDVQVLREVLRIITRQTLLAPVDSDPAPLL